MIATTGDYHPFNSLDDAGQLDGLEREQAIDFAGPYCPPRPAIYLLRAGAGDAALDGALVVTDNTIFSDYPTEQGTPYVPLDGGVAAAAALNGRIDAALVDHAYGTAKLAAHAGLEAVGPSLSLDQGLGIGLRPGSDLRATFNRALNAVKADGALSPLIRSWPGSDAVTFD